jgi:hypothetical protein
MAMTLDSCSFVNPRAHGSLPVVGGRVKDARQRLGFDGPRRSPTLFPAAAMRAVRSAFLQLTSSRGQARTVSMIAASNSFKD